MEVANVRLVLNKLGDDVPLKDVTPAECAFLHIVHGIANGGKTFGEDMDKIEVIGTAKVKEASGKLRDRTDVEELIRLGSKYSGARQKDGTLIIDKVWPNKLDPKLPQKFSDIQWQQVTAATQGIVQAPLNYATGAIATPALPSSK
jgi:hypothetical protein